MLQTALLVPVQTIDDAAMKIRTWWVNRAFLYWIPIIFVYDLPIVVERLGIASATINFSIAAFIILFFEQYLFSYKVDLAENELRYSQGLIWSQTIELKREDIRAACSMPTPIFTRLSSARLRLTTKDGRAYIASLASFRPTDITKVIEWLPVQVKRCDNNDRP